MELDLLGMWSCENDMSLANFSIHNSCFAFSRVNMQVFSVACKDLYASTLEFLCVDENATTIVIALKFLREVSLDPRKHLFMNLQICCPRPCLRVIDKPCESQTPANSRVEAQLSISHNSHLRIINFKLASCRAVVPSRAEAKVASAPVDVLADTAITFAIERPAVAQISSTRKYKQCARCSPWLFDKDVACDGDHDISWREEPPQGVEAVADRLSRASIAFSTLSTRCYIEGGKAST